MSGLYNMLLGRNPAAPYLLGVLGIHKESIDEWPLGRLRDVYTNVDGSKIFIFTRNGPSAIGLNEEERDEIDQNFLKNHPFYVGFEMDDFDETYLTYEFNTPPHATKLVKEIAEMTETDPPMERMKKLLDDMESGKDNEAIQNALEAGKKIFGPILEALGEGKADKRQVVKHGDGSVEIINLTPDKAEGE